jgi:RNA polymerase sigma factor (sigma-70 family)
LSGVQPSVNGDRLAGLRASAGELRPELHRYCARLMGSVIDGEDVVQDALARAFVALQEFEEKGFAQMPPLRPWLFRIAHNRALDLLRGRAVRMAEPIEAALDVADPANPDALEMLMRQEAVKTAVSCFAELSTVQRSVVILKDVLDESLSEIAALLDLTVDAVKGHLARGRARLREINAQADPRQEARPASATVARYVALFNRQDWDGLRALLADDVRLIQSTYSPRVGSAEVGQFFTIYARFDGVWLAPAWLEGREVIAVFQNRADPKPSYVMWLEWRDGRISFIRDYRYARYVIADVELALAPDGHRAAIAPAADFFWFPFSRRRGYAKGVTPA